MIRNSLCLAALVGLFASATPARAESVIFAGHGTNGASGHSLAATVEFKMITSTKLEITLTNTSTFDPTSGNKLVPSDLLTAVFFDMTGTSVPGSSNFLSAIAETVVKKTSSGSSSSSDVNVKYPGQNGGWRYANNVSNSGSGAPSQKYGFGTAGFNPSIFGGGGGGQQLDFGIVNDNYNPATDGNNGIGTNKLIKNSVTFTLSGLSANFNPLTAIKNVRFQYGTGLSEAHFDGTKQVNPSSTPEPSSFALMGLGSIGLFWASRRRKNLARSAKA